MNSPHHLGYFCGAVLTASAWPPQFKDAIAAFQQIIDACDDAPSKLFLERCEEYLDDPPGEGWDGVYRPKSK